MELPGDAVLPFFLVLSSAHPPTSTVDRFQSLFYFVPQENNGHFTVKPTHPPTSTVDCFQSLFYFVTQEKKPSAHPPTLSHSFSSCYLKCFLWQLEHLALAKKGHNLKLVNLNCFFKWFWVDITRAQIPHILNSWIVVKVPNQILQHVESVMTGRRKCLIQR